MLSLSKQPNPRTLCALWMAKAASSLSRALGKGGGTAVSGLVGLAIEPRLVGQLAPRLGRGSIAVTGTNGKTTTSALLREAARQAGLLPLANASGSNLMRGLASTLAGAAGPFGAIDDAERRLGVFEIDEATIPLALPQLQPRAVLFNNLFRDQLDRYGEVETVAQLWRTALKTADPAMTLVLNADDPAVASLGEDRGNVVYFGIEDRRQDRGEVEHASDALNCTGCGARLLYEATFIGHAGHWRCPSCGRARPTPDVSAEAVQLGDGRRLRFLVRTPAGSADVEMALGGLYNVYNALAATASALALGLPLEAALRGLASTEAAFGRQEAFETEGRRVELFLGKNPAGLNQVLSTLLLDPSRRTLLLILNDNYADGRDISWVWDADFEVAAGRFDAVVCSGTRAAEMALRLKYAEWDEGTLAIQTDLTKALEEAIAATPADECLSVVPTYTAMLEVRALLARRAGRAPFWQEARVAAR